MIETNDLRYEVTNSQPKIAFKRIGNGPPVIFLHGIGGHSMNWAHQQTELADSFSTIAWDARGYGNSEDPEGAREFSVFAGDLRRLLDELNIERAHFVGLSMGARILMDFYPVTNTVSPRLRYVTASVDSKANCHRINSASSLNYAKNRSRRENLC